MVGIAYILKGQLYQYQNNKKMRNERVRRDINNKFLKIKCLDDEDAFEKEFGDVFKSQILREYVTVNFYPQNAGELSKYATIVSARHFEYDFRWLLYCVKENIFLINKFVRGRKKIEELILFNKHEDALKHLEKIESECGVSYWSCECKIYLCKKLNINTKEDKDIPKGLPGFIFACYQMKNNDSISYDEYRYFIKKKIQELVEEVPSFKDIAPYMEYMLIKREIDFSEENIEEILKYAVYDSIVDQYLLLLDIVQNLIGKRREIQKFEIVKKYINKLEKIEDDCLKALRFTCDTTENRMNYIIKEGLLEAKNNFITGDINRCYEQTLNVLKEAPYNIEALNLYVETSTLLGKKEECFKGTLLNSLTDALETVYALRDERDQNLDKILKLVNIFSRSTWAVAVDNSILGRIHPIGSSKEIQEKNIVFAQYLDIETICHNLSKEECLEYLQRNANLEDPYILFRKLVVEKKYDAAQTLCKFPILSNLMFICSDNYGVKEKKENVISICGENAIMAVLIARGFFGTINLDKEYITALEVAMDLVISNKNAVCFLPIETYVKYLEKNDLIIKSIDVPILYYMYYFYFRRDKKDELAVRCDDFLYENNISLPSQMKEYKECTKDKLIFFLRYVCKTDVLNSAICEFENSQQLEKERIDICQLLCVLDKENEGIYEEEIREITQRLMINEELTIIEENRIHVNVEGIKRRIIENYKYDYLSYQLYVDERFDKYKRLLAMVNNLTKNENNGSIIIFDEDVKKPESLLRNIVTNIRDAFVSSDEYGLDGYLSLNIRHGTLADELRSPLVNAKLIASYNNDINEYEIDRKWLYQIRDLGMRKLIETAITDFYIETESIINDLKNKYIQVQTEKKPSEGCFNYCLEEGDFLDISMNCEGIVEFEDFIEIVIDFLWKQTELNLIIIKDKIKNEISLRYVRAFQNLRLKLDTISSKSKIRELNRKINEAETDMQNILERICFWFQRSEESKHADFDLEFVFLMGLHTIHNMHPECKFAPKQIKPIMCEQKIEGKYLKNFSNIFYNLLDNVYKNAKRIDNKVEFKYLLEYKNEQFHILIENPYDCSGDLHVEVEKIENAKKLIRSGKYLSKIKGEGGTGIPKICKIISVDLNMKPEINFDFVKEENKFYIELKFRKEQL